MTVKMKDIKEKILQSIQAFSDGDLTKNALKLFDALGYNTDRQAPLDTQDYTCFKATYADTNLRFNEDKALTKDWKYVDLLFQLSKEEINRQHSLFDTKRVDDTIIESYLFFAIELAGAQYTRTALSSITREINKLFPMPVMVLFKYGQTLTLAVISRRLHKRDESKDVLLKKVTLIKDINLANPHRAHIEILFDLSFDELLRKNKFANFVELHKAWEKTLDIKELNKRFYQELANWYFWAMNYVSFPDDVEKNTAVRNATNLIRLITRVIFIWFIKEKGLVSEALFDRKELSSLLKAFAQDKTSCNYYKAILQNLFFGTLNQKMDERGFAREGSFAENRSNYGVKNLFRYFDLFAVNEVEALNLFKDVPFLNGGLFDCLDKENEAGKVIYADGFSRNLKKQATVPDFLFFGDEEEYDLNEVYGTKNKRYKVHGLIDLLSHYKFTVTENTPIEEEVALDPELLGKVFENLLASYNPETQTTARKQTGSFYTPREIVNYMVDESLKAYLKGILVEESPMTEADAQAGLDLLFEYTEKEHIFNEVETKTLIDAIDRCKILDPACGSGAFPMGVLHKMVHILHKLDPNNKQWEQRQVDKVDKLIEEAQGITDTAAREQVVAGLEQSRQDIEDAFGSNELDYGRKLYLIENCIYGVDIQPIAVQIAKLRFFISLVIDQKKQPGKENLGIRALPNLETKFVAANTLIGLEKLGQGLLKNLKIIQLEKDLKSIRHKYFSAKTRRDKINWQKKDKVLREEISKLLVNDGLDKTTAQLIVGFDPYDQNGSAPFFDPEWMFGITDGFDVVIGNPPYVQIQKFSGMQEQQDWERQRYETYTKTGDIYCLFYEQGYRMLGSNGVLTFITSNKWMRANYGKAMRKFFINNGVISQLVDFGDSPIFENATTYTNVLIWKKYRDSIESKVWDLSKAYESNASLKDLLEQQGEREPLFNEDSFVIVEGKQTGIKKRIEEIGTPLRDWDVAINYGIKTGLNEAFIIDGKKKDELIAKDPKSAEIIKPILRGRDIKRYKAEFTDLWIINTHNGYGSVSHIDVRNDYRAIWKHLEQINQITNSGLERRQDQGNHWSNLRNCAYIPEFEKEKILYAEIVYDSAFYFDTKGFYPEATSFILTGERLKFLTALLNSKILTYAFKTFYAGGDLRGNTFRYKKVFLENLPVPKIPPDTQIPFEILVDHILFAKEKTLEKEAAFLEHLIDAMVYELYFPDEIKAADCEVLKHLTDLPELKDNWSDDQKLAAIEKIYRELSDPTHPVSIAIKKMQDIPEIRIIEGKTV